MINNKFFLENYKKALDLKVASEQLNESILEWVITKTDSAFSELDIESKVKKKSKLREVDGNLDFWVSKEFKINKLENVYIGIYFSQRYIKDSLFALYPYITLQFQSNERAKEIGKIIRGNLTSSIINRFTAEKCISLEGKEVSLTFGESFEEGSDLTRSNDLESIEADWISLAKEIKRLNLFSKK